MEEKVKAYIDYPNRKIVGTSGRVYKICPEIISSARYVEFELRAMSSAYKATLDDIIRCFQESSNVLKTGTLNPVGNAHEAITLLDGFSNKLINMAEFKRTESIEFCAMFCIYEGEDVRSYSNDMVAEKWEDWKEIPNEDFFLLSIQVKMLLSERYQNILKEAKEGKLEY